MSALCFRLRFSVVWCVTAEVEVDWKLVYHELPYSVLTGDAEDALSAICRMGETRLSFYSALSMGACAPASGGPRVLALPAADWAIRSERSLRPSGIAYRQLADRSL